MLVLSLAEVESISLSQRQVTLPLICTAGNGVY